MATHNLQQIPWDEIAFPVITETLKQYYRDRRDGERRTHYGEIARQPDNSYTIRYC